MNANEIYSPLYNAEKAQKIRDKYLTNKLSVSEKMELYNCARYGKYEELVSLDAKKYSLLEECSKAGYYWNVLHYVSHFGHIKLLEYMLKRSYGEGTNKFEIFNMQTVEGKTPVQCAITSGDITFEVKKEIVRMWMETCLVDASIRKSNNETFEEMAKKNNMWEFVQQYLRED